MQEVLHRHRYQDTPSLESLSHATLIGFWDKIPQAPSLSNLIARSQIEQELALHPDITGDDHEFYRQLRLKSDEELTARIEGLQDITVSLGHVFLPLVIGLGSKPAERLKETYIRAGRLFDLCEDSIPGPKSGFACGVTSELFYNLSMISVGLMSRPSLRREDMHSSLEGKKYCWDALVRSRGRHIQAGDYRVQIKSSKGAISYHPDVVVVVTNPKNTDHIEPEAFVDFARLAIPGTKASHRDLDRFHNRVHSMLGPLRVHGPSIKRKVHNRCLAEAA